MLNLHLNGDIVRCPDIAEMKKRLAEVRDTHNICRYNIQEAVCPAWKSLQQTALNESNFDNVKYPYGLRCHLAGSEFCPGHRKQKNTGNQNKSYKIDNTVYRKLASTAHYLVKETDTKNLFISLTFPPFKDDRYNNYLLLTQKEKKTFEHEINIRFSLFVKNLRRTYHCGGYIGVREFGKKAHRIHFHLLLSIPYVKFSTLNDSWNRCISDLCTYSARALTSDPKTRFVTDPVRAMRYVCKYFSKCKNQNSDTRLYFISNNIIQKPKKLLNMSIEDLLIGYKGIYINKTSDYTTLFRITDPKEFTRFCNEFLYPFFELSVKKRQSLYAFPLS